MNPKYLKAAFSSSIDSSGQRASSGSGASSPMEETMDKSKKWERKNGKSFSCVIQIEKKVQFYHQDTLLHQAHPQYLLLLAFWIFVDLRHKSEKSLKLGGQVQFIKKKFQQIVESSKQTPRMKYAGMCCNTKLKFSSTIIVILMQYWFSNFIP